MISKKINRIKSELRISSFIEVYSGSPLRQSYNAANKTYYPDRASGLSPLVLTPRAVFTVLDNGSVISDGNKYLTDGKWIRYDGQTSGGVIMTNGSGCSIVTTLDSSNYGEISISENVPPGESYTYVFEATLCYGGVERRIRTSVVSTPFNTTISPRLSFDNVQLGRYNPLEDEPMFSIRPYVMPSVFPVVFRWETMHDGKWGTLGSTMLDWALKVDATTGILTITRSNMQTELKLKCVAEVTTDDGVITVEKLVTHVRSIPRYQYDIDHVSDIRMDTRNIMPLAAIKSAKGQFGSSVESELAVTWYGGNTPIAQGINPQIPVNLLGSDMELGLDIQDRGGWCALADADGNLITDADGKLIITR